MRRELLHTPEGVRDIYNGEFDKKQRIEQELVFKFRLSYDPDSDV